MVSIYLFVDISAWTLSLDLTVSHTHGYSYTSSYTYSDNSGSLFCLFSPTLSTDICLDFTPQVFIPHDTAADLDLSSDDDGENLLDIDLPQLDGQQDKKGM